MLETDLKNSVKIVIDNDLCIGCGICSISCNKDAIDVNYDSKKGIFSPLVKESLCINCGQCLDVCFGLKFESKFVKKNSQNSNHSLLGHYKKCFIGYASEKKTRLNSSSGGLITSLLLYALEKGIIDGAIVTMMEKGSIKPKTMVATTPDEIMLAAGSKYCPTLFSDFIGCIEKTKRYAVVGLPCQLFGLRKLAEKNQIINDSLVYYFGIICGGVPTYTGTKYLFKTYNIQEKQITQLKYRSEGWPGNLLVERKYTNAVRFPYPQYWKNKFEYFLSYRCFVCNDCFNDFSDLSFGDAWLPRFFNHANIGTSIILVRNSNVLNLLQSAFSDGVINIEEIDGQIVIDSQKSLLKSKYKNYHAKITISKIFGKKLPVFSSNNLQCSNFVAFLSAMDLYFGSYFAKNPTFWNIFEFYVLYKNVTNDLLFRLKKTLTSFFHFLNKNSK